MYRLWLEQTLPSEFAYWLGSDAVVIGNSQANPANPLHNLAQAQAVLAGPALHYDAAFMDRALDLRVISRTGIGVDNIVIPDATARGIIVCNAPDAPTTSTAELTLALVLAATKRLKQGEHDLMRGEPKDYFGTYQGIQLAGLTLGIVGTGRIGIRVAQLAQAFGMQVMGWSRSFTPEQAATHNIRHAETLEQLLAASDIVSLHMPATPATRHIINAETIAQMKPGAYLINTSRGGLVDQNALLNALERGNLAGAGLDVFDPEPTPPTHPLLLRSDVTITPHVGGATYASKERLWGDAITQALQVLRGERPPHILNPELFPPK